jgi:asparagine synthase (glutamine-hydrolysing)
MCGICGIVTRPRSTRRTTRDQLVRMCDAIRHPDRDGEGVYLDDGVALGHRRLSIVDVAHGAQPMASDDGRFTIVYNGEVYNHPILMPELQAQGVQYHTHCDTETVLHLYERVGKALPLQLRGMFAIAIWDRTERELFLVRDRFGVKPVYYALLDDGTLVFGSPN